MRLLTRALFAAFVLTACCPDYQATPLARPAPRPTEAVPGPDPLSERIRSITERPEFRQSVFGIAIRALDTGEPLYRLNADQLFFAASTTKLVTEATGLDLLGPDFRFRTPVYRTGPILRDGTLNGDLVLVAAGDPNLSGRIRADGTLAFENRDHAYLGPPVPGDPLLVIRELAQAVAARGIKRVRGRVLVDASLFPGERERGPSPVVVNDNIIDITVSPGPSEGAPAVVTQSPQTSYLKLVNQTITGSSQSNPGVNWTADIANPDATHTVTVTGSVPLGKPAVNYPYWVPEPGRFVERVFAESLIESGVAVKLPPSVLPVDFKSLSAAYLPDQLVVEHLSPRLAEEIKVTLKVSQNLHASLMQLILPAVGAKGGTKNGFDLEREFLERAGLDPTAVQMGDGAGGNARFTPEFVVAFLACMRKHQHFSVFLDALPVLGRDGTLSDIQSKSAAAGHVKAKTGGDAVEDPLNKRLLVTARALAGYMTTASGRQVAFAIYLANTPAADWGAMIKLEEVPGEIAVAAYETIR